MRTYRQYLGRRVMVQLNDVTIDGKLNRAERDVIELVEATMVAMSERPTPIDGTVLIPNARVQWLQVV